MKTRDVMLMTVGMAALLLGLVLWPRAADVPSPPTRAASPLPGQVAGPVDARPQAQSRVVMVRGADGQPERVRVAGGAAHSTEPLIPPEIVVHVDFSGRGQRPTLEPLYPPEIRIHGEVAERPGAPAPRGVEPLIPPEIVVQEATATRQP
ncbi:MAG: hypothetical protein AB2A00_14080 [Myxococcota bacterium]